MKVFLLILACASTIDASALCSTDKFALRRSSSYGNGIGNQHYMDNRWIFDNYRFKWDLFNPRRAFSLTEGNFALIGQDIPNNPNMPQFTADNPQFPLNYRSAQIIMENDPPFCLEVGSSRNRMIKIIVEPIADDATLCISSANYDFADISDPPDLQPQCGVGRVEACFAADTRDGNPQFMVYCEECIADSTPFRYKVILSRTRNDPALENNAADNNLDMWCPMLDIMALNATLTANEVRFAEGVGVPDSVVIPENYSPLVGNSAMAAIPSVLAITLLALLQ